MSYKECFIIFAAYLRKHLTTCKLEETKDQPDELPFFRLFLYSSTKKQNQVSTFCIT